MTKQLVLLLTLITQSIFLFSQRELTVTEINSDNDAVIEIAGEDPTASDYTLMTLGFNQSNQAWLRTRTDHDLSFFTNDVKRFELSNEGDFTFRTRLFGMDGSRTMNLNFSTGTSNNRGGIRYCDCPADGGALMSFNMVDDGFFNFRSNGETRMFLGRDGEVRFGGLEGTETRTLYVDEDGELTTEASSFYVNVGPAQFQPNEVTINKGELRYRTNRLTVDYFFGQNGSILANAHPVVPHSKYRITEIEIEYFDNSSESIEVFFSALNNQPESFASVGQSDSLRKATLNTDILVDNETSSGISITVIFNDDGPMNLTNIKLKCTPVN